MKHFFPFYARFGTALATLFLLLATGLPGRAQQTEAVQQATQLALQTRSQWAGADISAASFRISNAHTEATGLLYAYPQQLQGGIPVYNQIATLVFKDGKLRHHAGAFLPTVAFAGQPAAPTVAAATAVATALASTKVRAAERPASIGAAQGVEQRQTFSPAGVAHRPIEVRLVWATDKGTPRLAWNVNVDLLATPDWLNIRVDAATGKVLGQDNWTVNENATHSAAASASPARAPQALRHPSSAKSTAAVTSASYRVVPLPGERPDVTTPNTDTNPWLRAGAGNAAATYGWHSDGAFDYTYTRGNNVWAYKDTLDTDVTSLAYSTYSTSTSGPLVFNDIPDFTKIPTLGRNRRAAVTNLFYWNNLMHDVMYQYGFTEAAGNFQASNLNRGGFGGDYVSAEAQDGGGTSNANFSTPSDGTNGRMQMYLFSVPAKVNVTAPANAAASYNAVESAFSTNNKLVLVGGVTGPAVYFDDAGSSPTTHNACVASATSLTGKIALIATLGSCTFATKVKAAQTAGAIGVIVLRSTAGAAVVMGGTDNTITIPAVMVSYTDGLTIANLVNSGLMVSIPGAGLDGDYDSGVMSHEYGHGISNRLTGGGTNTSCLYNAEQAGEGWSDYFGLMMTTNWTTAQLADGANARPIGTYVLGQSPTAAGIRRYPYTTNMTVNPLTYASMAGSTEVHNIGEIWCATLWDMTWNLIQMQGNIEPNLYNSAGTGGNAVALQLVMQGLKLQPCQPGFLDSRDAILAADSLLYNGRYHCAIWGAFARRGMGYSAREGSSNNATDQTAAYDVPNVTLSKNTTPLVGNRFSIAIKANCECPAQQNTYTITDQLPTDLQYLSSNPVGTLSGRTVTFANQTFTAGQTRTYRIQAQTAAGKGCAVTLPINDNREANTTGGLTAAMVTGTATSAWAATTTAAHSGTASWLAPSTSTSTNTTLTSVAFTPSSLAVLSFYHYANLTFSDGAFDGGVVAISTDNGTTWTDAAPYFLKNGYDATFLSGAPVPTAVRSKACFSGRFSTSPTPDLFIQSQLDLSSFTGQSIRVRFQMLTNTTYKGTDYGFTGWYLDDVQLMNGCGGNQQVQLLASGNATAVTSYLTPTFLTPIPAPLITSFSPTSGPVGTSVSITGTDLTGATLITFGGTTNNTVSTGFTVNATGTSITGIVVPSGAATGPLSVTTPGGVASTSGLTPANFTVIAPTTTTLASSLNPSTVGQQVTLTASVSGSGALPTGSVEFRDGTTLLSTVALGATGQASFQTSSLASGSHALTATYLGSATYAGSMGNVTQVVNAVTATTWTGNVSQDWFTAGNWTAGVPTSTIDAIIPTGRPLYPVMSSGTPTTRALNNAGTITQAGGTITVSGTLTNSGTITHSGGDITVSSALTNSSTFTFVGGILTVSGDLTNTGTFTTTNLAGTGGSTVVLGGGSTSSNILGSTAIRFWNLTVQATGAQLSTSAGASVRRVLTLTGSLTTQGNRFTIESASTGDGLVVDGGGTVVGTATVQRYIDPTLNSGLGYRHYSAPVSNTTVADLSTTASGGSFAPAINPAYNSDAAPTTVTPFPTVYGYDDSRLNLSNNMGSFDKGYVSPTALTNPLTVGRGYTVNIGASELVDFQGTLTTGDRSLSLTSTRPTYSEGGWQLLGNPYPAPLDYRLVAAADRLNLESAIYVYSSSSQYLGQYRTYINNVGNSVVAMGQGFFARVVASQPTATLNFHNSQRLLVPNSTKFQRPAETRPLVQLTLQGVGSSLLDEATVYFENGATTNFDPAYDAQKLTNPTGLNLSTSLAGGRQLSIDGQPVLSTTQRVVPLAVGVPTSGVYTFTATELLNLSTVPVYLRDLQTGALIDLAQQPSYSFTVATAATLLTGRFELVFSPQQPLATAPAALAAQVALYPNPATTSAWLELPLSLSRQPVTATLVDAVGRAVRTQLLPAGPPRHTLLLNDLAAGVYALRLSTELGTVVRKLVVE